MKTFILLILCLMAKTTYAQSDSKIIYVGDPMCSWCYGVTDEFSKTVEHYKNVLDVEMVMGGLRPYFDKPMTEMKAFLSEHWEQVHSASGQEFRYGILDRADLVYDTEPPCRASVIVRELKPESEQAFFKLMQKDFYYYNKPMGIAASYHESLTQLGIDCKVFDQKFDSDTYKERVKLDFRRAQELGVNSFPTILVEYMGERKVVARGYASSSEIIAQIDKFISVVDPK